MRTFLDVTMHGFVKVWRGAQLLACWALDIPAIFIAYLLGLVILVTGGPKTFSASMEAFWAHTVAVWKDRIYYLKTGEVLRRTLW